MVIHQGLAMWGGRGRSYWSAPGLSLQTAAAAPALLTGCEGRLPGRAGGCRRRSQLRFPVGAPWVSGLASGGRRERDQPAPLYTHHKDKADPAANVPAAAAPGSPLRTRGEAAPPDPPCAHLRRVHLRRVHRRRHRGPPRGQRGPDGRRPRRGPRARAAVPVSLPSGPPGPAVALRAPGTRLGLLPAHSPRAAPAAATNGHRFATAGSWRGRSSRAQMTQGHRGTGSPASTSRNAPALVRSILGNVVFPLQTTCRPAGQCCWSKWPGSIFLSFCLRVF